MPHLITDPKERYERIVSLLPGESIIVSKTPPLIGRYPRYITFFDREDRLIARRLSVREVQEIRRLESLPFTAADELY